MAKGSIAKENLMQSFIAAAGNNFIGEYDKKFYFWSTENGERVQVAVSMTVPKNPIAASTETTPTVSGANESSAPVEMTVDEQETLTRLMKELGL